MAKLMQWKAGMAESMYDSMYYTRYHEEIGRRMLPYLQPNARVCDGACGVGGIALALAPYVQSVYAVDRSERAIAQLRKVLQQEKIRNVTAEVCDLFALPSGLHFDAMEFMQYGSLEEILTLTLRHCDGTAFVISRNRKEHRFGSKTKGPLGFDYEVMAEKLQKIGIPFEGQCFTLQMGQPFRTMEEAKAFLSRYDDGAEPDAAQLAQLVPADSSQFQWFLPALSELGMLVFRTEDIPVDWQECLAALGTDAS